jgi:hypothetical protein
MSSNERQALSKGSLSELSSAPRAQRTTEGAGTREPLSAYPIIGADEIVDR